MPVNMSQPGYIPKKEFCLETHEHWVPPLVGRPGSQDRDDKARLLRREKMASAFVAKLDLHSGKPIWEYCPGPGNYNQLTCTSPWTREWRVPCVVSVGGTVRIATGTNAGSLFCCVEDAGDTHGQALPPTSLAQMGLNASDGLRVFGLTSAGDWLCQTASRLLRITHSGTIVASLYGNPNSEPNSRSVYLAGHGPSGVIARTGLYNDGQLVPAAPIGWTSPYYHSVPLDLSSWGSPLLFQRPLDVVAFVGGYPPWPLSIGDIHHPPWDYPGAWAGSSDVFFTGDYGLMRFEIGQLFADPAWLTPGEDGDGNPFPGYGTHWRATNFQRQTAEHIVHLAFSTSLLVVEAIWISKATRAIVETTTIKGPYGPGQGLGFSIYPDMGWWIGPNFSVYVIDDDEFGPYSGTLVKRTPAGVAWSVDLQVRPPAGMPDVESYLDRGYLQTWSIEDGVVVVSGVFYRDDIPNVPLTIVAFDDMTGELLWWKTKPVLASSSTVVFDEFGGDRWGSGQRSKRYGSQQCAIARYGAVYTTGASYYPSAIMD
jgi:hypothetical protein